jgi:hypothetical protein
MLISIVQGERDGPSALDDGLELSGVFERVLDDLVAGREDVLLTLCQLFLLSREIDATFLGDPATRVCKRNDSAFGFEEEEVLCVGDGEGGVCALAARGDFGADCVDEDLGQVLACSAGET